MFQSVFNALFSCSHRSTTFPQTPGRSGTRTYVVCLDCGKELAYDWAAMRISEPVKPHLPATEAQPMYLRFWSRKNAGTDAGIAGSKPTPRFSA
jgi:hypothetical protein